MSSSVLHIFQTDFVEGEFSVKLVHVFENFLKIAISNKQVHRIQHDGDSRLVFLDNQNKILQFDLFDYLQ